MSDNCPVDLDSPRAVKEYLNSRGITLKKRWGQNFLVSREWRRRVVELAEVCPGEAVWEIGPGIGSLTEGLFTAGADLTLFEIDHGLIELLRERFGEAVHIVPGDAVRSWQEIAGDQGPPAKIVGNLPYSSGARIIASFVESDLPAPPPMVVMVQQEVAERMVAPPASPEYSSFTVLVAACYAVTQVGEIGPEAFFPRPRVRSAVLSLTPREESTAPEIRRNLSRLARSLFASRRKTIRNGLQRNFDEEERRRLTDALAAVGVDPGRRGEELSPDTYRRLAAALTTRG